MRPKNNSELETTNLNHGLLVGNPPSGLLWVVIDRYDRVEVCRVGVCFPETTFVCLDLRLQDQPRRLHLCVQLCHDTEGLLVRGCVFPCTRSSVLSSLK